MARKQRHDVLIEGFTNRQTIQCILRCWDRSQPNLGPVDKVPVMMGIVVKDGEVWLERDSITWTCWYIGVVTDFSVLVEVPGGRLMDVRLPQMMGPFSLHGCAVTLDDVKVKIVSA